MWGRPIPPDWNKPYPPQENGDNRGEHDLILEEFSGLRDLKTPHEIVDFMLSDENYSAGFRVFREIAQEIGSDPDAWFNMNWNEVELELRTYEDIPIEFILLHGLQSVFKVAGNRLKKKGKKPKKGSNLASSDDFDPFF